MKVGLGTGSTAAFAVERLGMLLKDGTLRLCGAHVRGDGSRPRTRYSFNNLDEFSRLDVAIDGATSRP